MMLNELLGPFITIFTLNTTRYGLLCASFSVTGDGKTGGAAAGFALPQLARISWSPAHDLWTARRLIHPASSSLHRAP
jgi:hypothetical protein